MTRIHGISPLRCSSQGKLFSSDWPILKRGQRSLSSSNNCSVASSMQMSTAESCYRCKAYGTASNTTYLLIRARFEKRHPVSTAFGAPEKWWSTPTSRSRSQFESKRTLSTRAENGQELSVTFNESGRSTLALRGRNRRAVRSHYLLQSSVRSAGEVHSCKRVKCQLSSA